MSAIRVVAGLLVACALFIAPGEGRAVVPVESTERQAEGGEPTAERPTIIFVNHAATGANDGSSWADAFTDLQDALAAARSGEPGGQMWVAQGTYTPGPAEAAPDVSFHLVSGVALYGGFAGDETELDQRDWEEYETILSGDPDIDASILVGTGLAEGTIIDGFTIRDNSMEMTGHGAGIFLEQSVVHIANCIFVENIAPGNGGALFMSETTVTLDACQLVGNFAAFGGGIYLIQSTLEAVNCIFDSNLGGFEAAAVYGAQSNVHLTDCDFVSNQSAFDAGAIRMTGKASTLAAKNCQFSGNKTLLGGGAVLSGGGEAVIDGSYFIGNSAMFSSAISSSGSLTVLNCVFQNNPTENYAIAGGQSVEIRDSLFFMDSGFFGGAVELSHFHGSTATIIGSTFINHGTKWGGAGAVQAGATTTVEIDGCLFESCGNGAVSLGQGTAVVRNSRFLNNVVSWFWVSSAIQSSGSLSVINCEISGNVGPSTVGAAHLVMVNTLVSNNHSFDQVIRVGSSSSTGTAEILNSTIAHNAVSYSDSAGLRIEENSHAVVRNSIIWGHGEGEEVHQINGSTDVMHSCIQGLDAHDVPGANNIGDDPMFVSPVTGMTDDGDYRLLADSPAIDAGHNDFVPRETDTDLDGNPRIVDGSGDGSVIVDMGAFEFQPVCVGDLHSDGVVNGSDLADLLAAWGPCDDCAVCPADLDGNCTVNGFDLVELLSNWGVCP